MNERWLQHLTALPGVRALWRRFPVGSVELRSRFGIWERPQYAYGVLHAAQQAKLLGLNGITAIEFGVAGGNGLLALQSLARDIGDHLGLRISVWGFDSGEGMPQATDYRDLPYVWGEGFYQMEEARLRRLLSPETQLVLGDVRDTIQSLRNVAEPIGFVAFDLDYYSSTKEALRIFEFPQSTRLPRTYCYFDDVVWPEHACHNEWIGELLAIREFNEEHEHLKLAQIPLLRRMRPHAEWWNEQMYVLHDFTHPLYGVNLTRPGEDRELRLTAVA